LVKLKEVLTLTVVLVFLVTAVLSSLEDLIISVVTVGRVLIGHVLWVSAVVEFSRVIHGFSAVVVFSPVGHGFSVVVFSLFGHGASAVFVFSLVGITSSGSNFATSTSAKIAVAFTTGLCTDTGVVGTHGEAILFLHNSLRLVIGAVRVSFGGGGVSVIVSGRILLETKVSSDSSYF
jgi:hypothetical protein